MKPKILLPISVLVAIVLSVVFLLSRPSNDDETSVSTSDNQVASESDPLKFLLDGYPIEEVPLANLVSIESNKIFTNTDPINISQFGDSEFSYFNVVFETTATQGEFLEYYKNLFDENVSSQNWTDALVMGKIGEWRVIASHYGTSQNGYLQVLFQDSADESLARYFESMPLLLDAIDLMKSHEVAYGLINESGGKTEFTEYLSVLDSGDDNEDGVDDRDEFKLIDELINELYGDASDFEYNETMKTYSFLYDEYTVSITLSLDQGRVFIMMRKPL
jgi:hypothetical protein